MLWPLKRMTGAIIPGKMLMWNAKSSSKKGKPKRQGLNDVRSDIASNGFTEEREWRVNKILSFMRKTLLSGISSALLLTNSMAYGIRRFNAALTRALPQSLS